MDVCIRLTHIIMSLMFNILNTDVSLVDIPLHLCTESFLCETLGATIAYNKEVVIEVNWKWYRIRKNH
jgi:hypothetical protein